MENDKPKEKSPEEIKKEQEAAMVKQAEVAKKNLESGLWNYAAPKLVTHEQYGQLAKGAEAFYLESISKSPDQLIYEQLFLPQLANEGGAITSPYIQNTSAAILQESLASLKIEDAVKYFQYKGTLKPELMGKYVRQLDKETASLIIGSAMQYKTDDTVKKILELRQKNISKGLEEILAAPEKEKK
jgi:hypothetical protein